MWARSDYIQDQDLVREMFSLLHRQYDGVGEVSIVWRITHQCVIKDLNMLNMFNTINCEHAKLVLITMHVVLRRCFQAFA